MNSLEIKSIIKKDKVLSKSFAGIYARDQLNWVVEKRPLALIANTDYSSSPGQHWVAMYFDIDGTVDYFDSYGLYPYIPEFITFMKCNSKHQNYNTKHLQSMDSHVCGIYCIYFLHHRARHMSMYKLLRRFNVSKFMFNDKLVCSFMHKRFRYYHRVCRQKPQCVKN